MPIEVLVGVLVLSAAVNFALLAWVARADHVQIHWPSHLKSLANRVAASRPESDRPAARKRSFFVAESPHSQRIQGAAQIAPATPAALGRTPLSATLPPDLADFLARPATVGPLGDGFGVKPSGNGVDHSTTGSDGGDHDRAAMMARLPVASYPDGKLAGPGQSLDSATGLECASGWSRIVEIENARLLRYRRPVTVIVVEVEGLRRLAERLGAEPVDRLVPVVADALRRQARSSDWVARIGPGRFAALMPETDEIQAINYVERIRLDCEPWLASSALPLRLAIGWSSPAASSDLEFALARAEERMHLDRRLPGRSIAPPRIGPSQVVSLPQSGSAVPDERVAASDSSIESGGGVPPAETGRSGYGSADDLQLESYGSVASDGIPSGKSARIAPDRATGRTHRSKDEPSGGPLAGRGWDQ